MKKTPLIMLLVSATLSAVSADFESGGIAYSLVGRKGEVAVDQKVVDGVNSYHGVCIIPSTVNHDGENYRVTSIADHAFAASRVEEVVMSNTVRELGMGAFADAQELTSVTLPLSIDYIASECFARTALVDIAIPEGVVEIDSRAFIDCHQLHTVMLPSTLNYVGAEAFASCYNLRQVYCASPVPPIIEDLNALDQVDNADLVLGDDETLDNYLDDPMWGADDVFTMFPHEDLTLAPELSEEIYRHDWKRVSLPRHIAYKIINENDEMVAVTAATNVYLPATNHDATYTIIPTTIIGDADPIYVTVEKTTGIKELIDEALPAEPEPVIVARQGTIYVWGNTKRRLLSVWDMSGRLYYMRVTGDAQVIDLPRNRVYIVRLGNHVKKILI